MQVFFWGCNRAKKLREMHPDRRDRANCPKTIHPKTGIRPTPHPLSTPHKIFLTPTPPTT